MKKNKRQYEEEDQERDNMPEEVEKFLKRKTLKDLIAPSGIDASHIDHLEIISHIKRYA